MNKLTLATCLLAMTVVASSQANTSVVITDANGVPMVKQRAAVPTLPVNSFTKLEAKTNGSGVSVAYRIEGTPVVGNPVTIRLQVSSSADAQLAFRSNEGLSLITPDLIEAPAGANSEYTVTVVPAAEGRFYLNVFSIANGRPSASAIAVQVGNKAVQFKPAGKVMESSSGERVISVPVK
jgi:hypothetical protein